MVNLKMVTNSPDYYEFIRELRTDPKNINGFVERDTITPEQQQKYMEKYSECYEICLLDNKPVGFIGVVDRDIRFAVKPTHHGQGIGKFMMRELIKKEKDVLAKVMIDNIASSKVFESCGFNIYDKDEKFLYYKL